MDRSVIALLASFLLFAAPAALSQGVLDIEILNGHNLVVDSNVTAPSTYAPSAGYIGARVCNTGNAALSNVIARIGDFGAGTAGTFPSSTFAGPTFPHLAGTGSYALTLEAGDAGTADGTRYIGNLNSGECRMQYWLISYPRCVNNPDGSGDDPPCTASIAGGSTTADDPSLDYDIWATTTSAIAQPTVDVTRDFTLRNEISAAANKIWPNTTAKVPDEYLTALQAVVGWGTLGPDGQPYDGSNPVFPGQRVITTQGIWYDLGNVGGGFDNDGDLVADQNAWLQPVGDAAIFDAGCFRLVNVYGIVIVKLKSGGELLIPFQNELYFTGIPDNTGVVGLVYYQYVATGEGCSAQLSPYQEAASGSNNEKFSADYGLTLGLVSGSFAPGDLAFAKTDGLVAEPGTGTTTTGSTFTYTISGTNTAGVNLGATDLGMPLSVRDSIPAGTVFVAGSADDTPGTNLVEPTGTGSYTQEFTDNQGNLDGPCTIAYNISASSWVILYSTDGGSTWTTTEPPAASVTDVQWQLFTTIQKDGGHDGVDCVAPDTVYDNGVEYTSLPAGKSIDVRFQVTVAPTGGPVVCNTATLGFGGSANGRQAEECTLISGNNSISGTLFRDDAGTGGIFGNGVQDNGTETGIGAGVEVTLYYDLNGDGRLDGGDLQYGSTTTNASGDYSFTGLPDGPFLVVANKYDDGSGSDSATDSSYATNGWGSTTADPNLPLTTDTGIVRASEDVNTVVLAVNVDLDRSSGAPVTLATTDFGFAPPLLVTKSVAFNVDGDNNGTADLPVDEGSLVSYTLALQNRLPSVGVQGPTGCQYTVWASTGGTGGSPKNFLLPGNAYDAASPNGTVATALVEGGGNRFLYGNSYSLAPQLGSVTKVEALFFGYFNVALTDDYLNLAAGLAGTTVGANGITGTLSTRTITTALIDSYVGATPDFDPNRAISWDLTATRPGGGTWGWTDFPGMYVQVNPAKAAAADAKTFSLDAVGLRVTSDQNCEAGASSTLTPVPLLDTYDTASFTFVSATTPPTSVNTGTGVIQWDDVGPILPGTTKTVVVTLRAKDVAGTQAGSCASLPPSPIGLGCNYAQTGWGGASTYPKFGDGRQANSGSDSIAVNIVGRAELRGTVWNDVNNGGWPIGADTGLSGVTVTLWGCVGASGLLMETGTSNSKDCAAMSSGNFWSALATAVTDSAGAYEFLGLRSGYYLVEVGDTDGSPTGGNTAPYGKTQTGEPDDDQSSTAGSADGHSCGTCNNIWGSSTANLRADQTTINFLDAATEETVNGVNFGYYSAGAAIFGQTWFDVDGDAFQDPGEIGQSGFTVRIYTDPNGDGNPADGILQTTTVTDANGNYTFTGLGAGNYVVEVVPSSLPNKTWIETVESTGGTGSLNNQIPVTVAAGEVSGPRSFGYTQADTADIGDSIFIDLDGDGIRDATESGIPDITVWLYLDVDRDGVIDAGVDTIVATDVTDASGNYLFEDFPEGSYIVKVDMTDPDFPTNVTPTGDPDLNTGRIGDFVFFDSDGDGAVDAGENGIPGVTVNLYRDSDGSGTFNVGDMLVASVSTDVNGNYLFTGLAADDYFVDVDTSTLPSSALQLTTANPSAAMITLATSSSSFLGADAGYSPTGASYAIGNRVWHDVDADGVQDPGEVGIPGIDISVTGPNCAPCTATTDESGFWIVAGLTATGNYTVDVDGADLPRDFTLTVGSTDPRNVTLASADNMNVDFGYRYTGAGASPTASVTGRVFLDADADLAYDAGEERTGTTVNLFDENGYIVATTTTDASGNYTFSGAFVGNYTVQAVDQLGARYSSVFLSAGSPFTGINIIYTTSTETVADGEGSVSIDGVHDNLLMDFGFLRYLGSIGDSVYYDVNENGTKDLGEPGLDGVTVRLYTGTWIDANGDGFVESTEISQGPLVATATTAADDPGTPAVDESGQYIFANLDALPADTFYLVRVDDTTLPAGSDQTADPDTDGTPCALLPSVDNPAPAGVCDHRQLVISFKDGNNYLGGDFGYTVSSYASIGDHLWIDTDNDGILDPGEQGIPYVTVWIDDGDGLFEPGETSVESDSDGYFVFPNVADGNYNIRVLTSDPQWPSGLSTTPTYEADASLNSSVQVTVASGVVNVSGGCSDCGLSVDFGYRFAGTNSVSGTICTDDSSLNGYCGATALTYSGTTTDESPLSGIQVGFYRWVDNGNGFAWDGSGALDALDSFTLVGTATTDSFGDYSIAGLPDQVIAVFSLPAAQNLILTTTGGNTSVEDVSVSSQLFNGTTTYGGNDVTVFGRQALNLAADGDDTIVDLDFAFDATLNGAIGYDFGDLPASYSNTLLADGGAQNRIGTIFLGGGLDADLDGTESSSAAADNNDDGVGTPPATFTRGSTANVTVTASEAGWLGGWIDWNNDGDFNDGEETFVDQAVAAGANVVSFDIPTYLTAGINDYFVRFRIYTTRPSLFSSTGVALDATFQPSVGEVEDYRWNVTITPAIITSFRLREMGNRVAVEWSTASGIGTAGFELQRWDATEGTWLTVNEDFLPALLGEAQGGRYRYLDEDALPGTSLTYRLVEIEASGRVNYFGPYTLTTSVPDAGDPAADGDTELPEDRFVRGFWKASHGQGRAQMPGIGNDPSFAKEAAPGKPADAIGAKIAVGETGLQFVSVADIEKAGYPVDKTWLSANKNLYAFANRGETVAFMAAPDQSGIYFYGRAVDSIFAADNVYWLGASTKSSPRMKVRKEKSVSPPRGDETFDRTIRFEEDHIPATNLFNDPEASYWVWDYLVAGQGVRSFKFRTDGLDDGYDDVTVTIRLVGGTDTPVNPDHHATFKINGRFVGETFWDGTSTREVRLRLDASDFADGENTLEVEGLKDTGSKSSVFYVDTIDVDYTSLYRARMNRADFPAGGNASVLVSGFTRPDIMVFDITDPLAPVSIEAQSVVTANGYGVALSPDRPTNVYVALTPDAAVRASRIKPDTPSDLKGRSNLADYLIITTREMADTAQRLATIHPDLKSMVVDIEDIWDEFNYGVAGQPALRDFLAYASKEWVSAPKYVVLAGDGSFDYKNKLGLGGNFVPAMNVKTPFGLFASDNWLANLDGKGAPEIAIGRLPATSPASLSKIIDRIEARERAAGGAWTNKLLMLADNADYAGNFPVDSDRIATTVPATTTTSKIYLNGIAPATARSLTIQQINQGLGFVNYIGHGSLSTLASEGILRNSDLPMLANTNQPFVLTAATCLVGYYTYPGFNAMSELLLRDGTGGAAAVWSASGMSQNEHAVVLNEAFYKAALAGGSVRVGDAVLSALREYEKQGRPSYMLDIYVLLGDPAMRLR